MKFTNIFPIFLIFYSILCFSEPGNDLWVLSECIYRFFEKYVSFCQSISKQVDNYLKTPKNPNQSRILDLKKSPTENYKHFIKSKNKDWHGLTVFWLTFSKEEYVIFDFFFAEEYTHEINEWESIVRKLLASLVSKHLQKYPNPSNRPSLDIMKCLKTLIDDQTILDHNMLDTEISIIDYHYFEDDIYFSDSDSSMNANKTKDKKNESIKSTSKNDSTVKSKSDLKNSNTKASTSKQIQDKPTTFKDDIKISQTSNKQSISNDKHNEKNRLNDITSKLNINNDKKPVEKLQSKKRELVNDNGDKDNKNTKKKNISNINNKVYESSSSSSSYSEESSTSSIEDNDEGNSVNTGRKVSSKIQNLVNESSEEDLSDNNDEDEIIFTPIKKAQLTEKQRHDYLRNFSKLCTDYSDTYNVKQCLDAVFMASGSFSRARRILDHQFNLEIVNKDARTMIWSASDDESLRHSEIAVIDELRVKKNRPIIVSRINFLEALQRAKGDIVLKKASNICKELEKENNIENDNISD